MISFGNKSIYLLCPLFLFIFSSLRMYIELYLLFPVNSKPTQEMYIAFSLFKTFLNLISNFLFGIPSAILWCFDKKQEKALSLLMNKQKLAMTKIGNVSLTVINNPIFSSHSQMKNYLIILGLSVILCSFLPVVNYLNLLDKHASQIGYSMNILLIIINAYFTHRLLKYPLFKHHLAAIGLCLIGIVFVQIPGYIGEYDSTNLIALYFSFAAIQFLVSTLDITEKWLMEKRFVTLWNLIFLIGLFGVIILAIFYVILTNINCPITWVGSYCSKDESIVNINDVFEGMDTYDVIWSFLLIFCGSLHLLSYYLTNFFFTPTHRSVSDIFSSFVFWIPTFTPYYGFLSLTGYLIALFGSLVYNEILILEFWKLDENTKDKIYRRSVFESRHQCMELLNQDDSIEIEE